VVREHGAGTGALAEGILEGLQRAGSGLLDAIRYQAVEASPTRLRALGERLTAAGFGAWLDPADEEPAPGAILANELLDALPVHRVRGGEDGALEELFVTAGEDGFEWLARGPSTDGIRARLEGEGVRFEPGQVAEVNLEIDAWMAGAAGMLADGVVLVIDYGHPAAQLYAPARGSTLRAYHRHRVHDDPFVAVGRQDLTAHVDLTAVERAAEAAGLHPLGRTTQGQFLAGLGLGELLHALQSDPATTLERYLAARSAVVRMLDPRATGFAVMEFERQGGQLGRGPR
jgi:SAM-dependent MidA family methyltransferase